MLNDDTGYRVKMCNIGNLTTAHGQFNMLPVTRDVFVENYGKVWLILWNFVNSDNKSILDIDANHCIFRILMSAAIFVYNVAFDIARSVRNVSGCTLLRDVKLACKNTQILHANYLDFTIHYLLDK